MSVVLVTGSAGLIGSEAVRFFAAKGYDIVGIDNDMRKVFFGEEASTQWCRRQLEAEIPKYRHRDLDIRDQAGLEKVFREFGKEIALVIHTAAQPSHDWAAREPLTDFSVNATATLLLLECLRLHAPQAVFIFTSTNKVYGDTPNLLPLEEQETRWEVATRHPYATHGIDESMSLDQTKHSLFGASKVAADILVQEYGRYFGLKTGVFRGGCLTGPAHSATKLHGFLGYVMRCALTGTPYSIFGYKGKQVRDNIHSSDLIQMFWEFFRAPKPGEVYNAGGSRFSNCSVLEAIRICEEVSGKKMKVEISDQARIGDHIWWISDVRKFQKDYPAWKYEYDLPRTVQEIHEAQKGRI